MTMQLSDEVRQYDLTKTLQDCERAYQRGYLHGVSRGMTAIQCGLSNEAAEEWECLIHSWQRGELNSPPTAKDAVNSLIAKQTKFQLGEVV